MARFFVAIIEEMIGADRTSMRAAIFAFALAFFALAPLAYADNPGQGSYGPSAADLECKNLQKNEVGLRPCNLGSLEQGVCVAEEVCQAKVCAGNACVKTQIPPSGSSGTGAPTQSPANQTSVTPPANSNLNSNLFNPTPSAQQQNQVQPNVSPANTSPSAIQGIENMAKSGLNDVTNFFSPTQSAQNPAQPSFTGSPNLENAAEVQPTAPQNSQPLYDSSSFQSGQQTFGGGSSIAPETSCDSWWCSVSSAASSAWSSVKSDAVAAGDYLFGGPEGSGEAGIFQPGQLDAKGVTLGEGQSLTGIASCYGNGPCGDGNYFDGRTTAYGDTFHSSDLTAASNQLAPGNYTVECVSGDCTPGSAVTVKVNDTGSPKYFGLGDGQQGRVLDLSTAARGELGGSGGGLIQVKITSAGDSSVPLPQPNPQFADVNTSALPVATQPVEQGPDLAQPNPTVAVTSQNLPDITPDYNAAIPKTEQVDVTPEQIASEANAQLTKDAEAAIPPPNTSIADRSGEQVTQDINVEIANEQPSVFAQATNFARDTAASAWDNLKYGLNSINDYFSGGGVTPQEAGIPVVPPALSTNDLLGTPEPLPAAPTTPVLLGTDLPAPDTTVLPTGSAESQPQFDNPYPNQSSANGTVLTGAQLSGSNDATQLAETNPPLPQSRPDIVVDNVPTPTERPSDLPINGSDVSTGSDVTSASPATDERLRQSPDTVDVQVPLPEQPKEVPEATDAEVRAAFDQKISDAKAQIAYAQSLVAAHPDSPTAQALLDESNKRLDAIVSNSISYASGNPSPELQGAIDQINSGAQQGVISGALASLSDKANADADTIAAGMKTSYDLSTLSGVGDAAKSLWDAGAWGLAKGTAALAGVANDGLSKLGAPGFSDPTAALNNAIDPYGKDYQTANDLAVVAPFGYGAAKSLVGAGIDASISGFAAGGERAAADALITDSAAPAVITDSAGFPSVNSAAPSIAEAPAISAAVNDNVAPAIAQSSGSVDAAVANLDDAVAEVRAVAGGSTPPPGMADVYANFDKAVADVRALDLPSAPPSDVDAAVARLDQAVNDIKTAAPNAEIPNSSVSDIDAALTRLDNAVADVKNAAEVPEQTTTVKPSSPIDNALAKVDEAVSGVKASATHEPTPVPSTNAPTPAQTGAPEIPPQTSRPSVGPGEVVEPQPQSSSWLDTVKSWFTSSNQPSEAPVQIAEANPPVVSDAAPAVGGETSPGATAQPTSQDIYKQLLDSSKPYMNSSSYASAEARLASDASPLTIDENGNVVLTRAAYNFDQLIKNGEALNPQDVLAQVHGGRTVGSSGLYPGIVNTSAEPDWLSSTYANGYPLSGTFKIPASDFVTLAEQNKIILGQDPGEVILSGDVAQRYLADTSGFSVPGFPFGRQQGTLATIRDALTGQPGPQPMYTPNSPLYDASIPIPSSRSLVPVSDLSEGSIEANPTLYVNSQGEAATYLPSVAPVDSSAWTGQNFQGFDIKAPWQQIPVAEIPVPEGNAAPNLIKAASEQPELPLSETPQLQPSDITPAAKPAIAETSAVPSQEPTVAPTPTLTPELGPIGEELPSPASNFEIPKTSESVPTGEPPAPKVSVAPTEQTEALGESAPPIVSEDTVITPVDVNNPEPGTPVGTGSSLLTKLKATVNSGLTIGSGLLALYELNPSVPASTQTQPDTSEPLPGSAPSGQGGARSDATAPKPVYDQPPTQAQPKAPSTPVAPPDHTQSSGSGSSFGLGGGFSNFVGSLFGSLMQMMMRQSSSPSAPSTAPLPNPQATSTATTTPIAPPPSVVSLIANPISIESGKTTKLSWSSVGAKTCTLFGPGNAVLGQGNPDSSTSSPTLSATTAFLISCTTNSGGTIYATTSVTVK